MAEAQLSEWMKIMLEEIERKRVEERNAREEERVRSSSPQPDRSSVPPQNS